MAVALVAGLAFLALAGHALAGNFQQFVVQTGTPLLPLGDDFGYAAADWDGDQKADLFAIKHRNTGTGTIEAHILQGPRYQQFVLQTGTPITPLGQDFDYALGDFDGDHNADLYAIKHRNTGTSRIEVHVLAGPTPAPAAAASGVHVIGHTSSTLQLQWTDNEPLEHGWASSGPTGRTGRPSQRGIRTTAA